MSEMLDLSALRNATASLCNGIDIVNDSVWFDQQPERVQNILISGVIKNFEFTYEVSMKMIRRYLELEADSPTEIDQSPFREVIRLSAEKGLIANVTAWFHYREMRNITSHTYDHNKAQQVYREILTFADDARFLLAQLEARNV